MSKFINWLEELGLNEECSITGISAAEIHELAAAQEQSELPAAYQEFLRDCGRSAGLFQRDAVFFFPQIKNLKNQLLEMFGDEGIEFSLPRNAFVFGAYQGFQFHYFICDGVDDPEIYQIDDGGDKPVVVAEKFSTYIRRGMLQYQKAFYEKRN